MDFLCFVFSKPFEFSLRRHQQHRFLIASIICKSHTPFFLYLRYAEQEALVESIQYSQHLGLLLTLLNKAKVRLLFVRINFFNFFKTLSIFAFFYWKAHTKRNESILTSSVYAYIEHISYAKQGEWEWQMWKHRRRFLRLLLNILILCCLHFHHLLHNSIMLCVRRTQEVEFSHFTSRLAWHFLLFIVLSAILFPLSPYTRYSRLLLFYFTPVLCKKEGKSLSRPKTAEDESSWERRALDSWQ